MNQIRIALPAFLIQSDAARRAGGLQHCAQRLVVVVLVGILMLLASAPNAHALFLNVAPSGILFVADPTDGTTETNDIVIGQTGPNTITITEFGNGVYDINNGCVPDTPVPGTVECTGVTSIVDVSLEDGNDVLAEDFGNPVTKVMSISDGAGNDNVVGGGGNDMFVPGLGNDSMDGSGGSDAVWPDITTSGTTTTLSDAALTGTDFGTDSLVSMESTQVDIVTAGGATFDSTGWSGTGFIWGSAGNDTFTDGAAGLTFSPGSGADTITAGGGSDTVSITTSSCTLDGVIICNGVKSVTGVDAWQVIGTGGADTFEARNLAATVSFNYTGHGGADSISIDATALGTDYVDGGDGADQLIVSSNAATTVGGGTIDTGTANDDIYVGINSLRVQHGGAGSTIDVSTFVGTTNLNGGGGNDTILGSNSVDVITAGEGDDIVEGNGDNDVVNVTTVGATSTITNVDVELSNGDSVTFSEVEGLAITGTGVADTLDSSTRTDPTDLYGMGGDDTFIPGGTTLVDGGAGTDTLQATLDPTGSATLADASITVDGVLYDTTSVDAVTITGGTGINTIDASAFSGAATINAGNGADIVMPSTGGGTITGGDGTDTVQISGRTNASISGTAITGFGISTAHSQFEEVSITGTAAINTLSAAGFTGTATIDGAGGNDTITVSAGPSTVNCGLGDSDTVAVATANPVTVLAGQFDYGQVATFTGCEDGAIAGDTPDQQFDLTAAAIPMSVSGGGGSDRIIVGTGNITFDGGVGDDTIEGTGSSVTVTDDAVTGISPGTIGITNVEFADITGTAGADTINAASFAGGLVASGLAGNDTLIGGAGNDTLAGGTNTDIVRISSNAASLTISNTAAIGHGADTFTQIESIDVIGGASGQVINAASVSINLDINGGSGSDTISGGSSASGDDLIGGGGADTINAVPGADRINGGNANDILRGGAGNDLLLGGGGNDRLEGGAGADTFRAGSGNDSIRANDRTRDVSIRCDSGRDTAHLDRRDPQAVKCERVTRR
jgi:Ca2+-binding RTX toxin-like protein